MSSLSCATDIEDLDDERDILAMDGKKTSMTYQEGFDIILSVSSNFLTIRSVYASYLSQLYSFIDGSLDATRSPPPSTSPSISLTYMSNRYEENTRNILGNRSYVLYTIDKVLVLVASYCLYLTLMILLPSFLPDDLDCSAMY